MKKYSSITKASFRRSTTKRWQIGFFLTIAVLLVGWLIPSLASFLSYIVMTPVVTVSTWYEKSESAIPLYFRSRASLNNEIQQLKQSAVNETSTKLSIKRLLEENMQLRAAALTSSTTERVVARVIAQPTRLNYDLLQIDQGTNSGVVVGAPVFLGFDTVIGVVVKVAPTYAFVDLLTTAGFSATAYIVGPNIFAPLEGMGGGVARVKVPQGIELRIGNLVLLPSVSSGVYGEVVSLENIATQPEQYGYVTPPLPLKGILYVSVATDIPPQPNDLQIDKAVRQATQDYFKLNNVPVLDLATGTNTASSADIISE